MPNTAVMKKKYTYEDYLKTPDDKRYELVEGEMTMSPAPSILHQRISRKLELKLAKFVEDNNLGEVFDAPCDVYLHNENIVQPDLLFISRERQGIIGEKNIQGAPDMVVEIISESAAYRDTIQKKRLYAKFGVKEYWIAVPGEKMIEVHFLEDKEYRHSKTYSYEDTLESQVLNGIRVELKDIF